jgi:hypothetical protein
MRRTIYAMLLACLSFLSACDLNTSNNGDFDGYWQFSQIDTLKTGRSGDVRKLRVFWSVQAKLLEINNLTYPEKNVLFHFSKASQAVHLKDPVANFGGRSDSIISSPSTLVPYGVIATFNADHRLEALFHIDLLHDDNMILSNGQYRLHFRRY